MKWLAFDLVIVLSRLENLRDSVTNEKKPLWPGNFVVSPVAALSIAPMGVTTPCSLSTQHGSFLYSILSWRKGVRNLSGGGQKSARWGSEICQVGVRNLSGHKSGQKSVRTQNYKEKACPPPPPQELLHSLTQVGFEWLPGLPPPFLQGISCDIQLS